MTYAGYPIKRRRYCPNCQATFVTHEVAALEEVDVLKSVLAPEVVRNIVNETLEHMGKQFVSPKLAEHLTRQICSPKDDSPAITLSTIVDAVGVPN